MMEMSREEKNVLRGIPGTLGHEIIQADEEQRKPKLNLRNFVFWLEIWALIITISTIIFHSISFANKEQINGILLGLVIGQKIFSLTCHGTGCYAAKFKSKNLMYISNVLNTIEIIFTITIIIELSQQASPDLTSNLFIRIGSLLFDILDTVLKGIVFNSLHFPHKMSNGPE